MNNRYFKPRCSSTVYVKNIFIMYFQTKSNISVHSLSSHNDANNIDLETAGIWRLICSSETKHTLQLFSKLQSSRILETEFLSSSLGSSHSQINDSIPAIRRTVNWSFCGNLLSQNCQKHANFAKITFCQNYVETSI